jgi:hypothetical protein
MTIGKKFSPGNSSLDEHHAGGIRGGGELHVEERDDAESLLQRVCSTLETNSPLRCC